MNISDYIFGSFSSGYTQYPDDSSAEIFKNFAQKAKAKTQLCIRRDGNLMYYGYIRKLQAKQYIGFCVVLNGAYIYDIDSLFKEYEEIIGHLVEKGDIIHLDKDDVASHINKLYQQIKEIENVRGELKRRIEKFGIETLPPENYSVGKNSEQDFSFSDDITEILMSSYKNGYTFVYKDEDYDSSNMYSFRSQRRQLENEKDKLASENQKLREKNKTLNKQKKRVRTVAILSCVLLTLMGVLALLGTSYFDSQQRIVKLNNEVDNLSSEVSKYKERIQTLQADSSRLAWNLSETNNKLKRANESIETYKADVDSLKSKLAQVKKEKSELRSQKQQITSELSSVKQENSDLRSQIRRLSNSSSQNRGNNSSSSKGTRYRTLEKTKIYYRSDTNKVTPTKLELPYGNRVIVYSIVFVNTNRYGVTDFGLVNMKNLIID